MAKWIVYLVFVALIASGTVFFLLDKKFQNPIVSFYGSGAVLMAIIAIVILAFLRK